MTDWIDFLIYAVYLAILWFGVPGVLSRFNRAFLADRNPDWMTICPALVQKLNHKWFVRSSYAIGALSLGALLSFQLGFWPVMFQRSESWKFLKDISLVSTIAAAVYFCCFSFIFNRWLRKEVPLPERRQATLKHRSIDDFVSRRLQTVVYGIVIIHLAAWLTVSVLGRNSTPALWGLLAFQFIISAFLFVVAHANVRRRPRTLDRIFGGGYRRTEVRIAFVMQLIPLPNGIARLYEQITGTVVVDLNRILQLGLVLLIILGFLRFFLLSRTRHEGRTEPPRFGMALTIILILFSATSILGTTSVAAQASLETSIPSNDEIRKILVNRIIRALASSSE